jgi:hypothetical protein
MTVIVKAHSPDHHLYIGCEDECVQTIREEYRAIGWRTDIISQPLRPRNPMEVTDNAQ